MKTETTQQRHQTRESNKTGETWQYPVCTETQKYFVIFILFSFVLM